MSVGEKDRVAATAEAVPRTAGRADVRRVRPDGIIETVRGTVRDELGLVTPQDVSVAADGSLLIAHFERVWRVARDGTLTVFAGNGRDVYDGDGGPATDAGITQPEAVAAMPDGAVLIAQSDERLRRVALDGTIRTVPGSFGFSDLAAAPGAYWSGRRRSLRSIPSRRRDRASSRSTATAARRSSLAVAHGPGSTATEGTRLPPESTPEM